MTAAPLETLGDLVHHLREQWGGQRELLRASDGSGSRVLSSKELVADTHALALSLERLGARPGDRLAVLAGNRPGWLVVDLACHLLGLVTVPVDPRLASEQIGFVVRNSRPAFLVYGGERERELLQGVLSGLQPPPVLISIEGHDEAAATHQLMTLIGQGAERLLETSLDSLRGRVRPDDPATLSYTSGATGDPKGVLLSHRSLLSRVEYLGPRLGLGRGSRGLSLLPWAHPVERLALYAYLDHGIAVVAAPEPIDPILALAREQPSHFVMPPGLLETIRRETEAEIERGGRLRRWRFRTALQRALPREGSDRVSPSLLARRGLAPLRRALGGAVRVAMGSFSPVAPRTEALFRAAGVDLCLGYGLVETGGPVTATARRQRLVGTVGQALPGFRLATGRDGEISVSGPGLMLRYWHQGEDEELAEGVAFATGDIGRLDPDGRLRLSARRSSQIRLTGGERIAPHPIEIRLQSSPLIERAIVVGQGRPDLGALIQPASRRTPEAGSQVAPLEARVLAELQRLNQGQPEEQRIRRFHLLPTPLSVESGELTRNGQLRRRVIADRWGDAISALWNDAAPLEEESGDDP